MDLLNQTKYSTKFFNTKNIITNGLKIKYTQANHELSRGLE